MPERGLAASSTLGPTAARDACLTNRLDVGLASTARCDNLRGEEREKRDAEETRLMGF